MSADGEAVQVRGEADEPGWEVDPDDEWGVAVVATVGRQLKLRRESVGMRVADFAAAMGYGEDLAYKVEAGNRIPRPEYLEKADEVLGAGGLLAAMSEDVAKVRDSKNTRGPGSPSPPAAWTDFLGSAGGGDRRGGHRLPGRSGVSQHRQILPQLKRGGLGALLLALLTLVEIRQLYAPRRACSARTMRRRSSSCSPHAHQRGPAVAQKNTAELAPLARRWASTVRRDRDVTAAGSPGYVREICEDA
ncbi:hypothetical protein GCM10027073_01620 [Streptomyces chlorus]|uniref:Helix-turn-helix domain-containing protein n=1 Tax=Streptomyces chlorus TaxID=887452 RepID=A0ABW1DXP7_9ACTN